MAAIPRNASYNEVVKEPLTSFPKSKIKILLLENISKSAVRLFEEEGFSVECYPKLSVEDLKEKIKRVHAIGVRSKTKLTPEVLAEAQRLMAVGCFCIGTDQTDLEYAASKGIAVFNSPYANTRSVAELVLGEMIALARQFVQRSVECHSGIWNKESKGCYEIRGKTLGIIGYGHVGSQLSVLAESMGMKVIFYDIAPVLSLGNATMCRNMEELLSRSDFVSLHVPLTPGTIGLIGAREISLMQPGTYFINAARGEVVDVPAVAAALKSKHLAGAAFDVFPKEPAAADESFESELRGLPNTILTPHIGGSTEEAQSSIGVDVASKIIAYINFGRSVGSVNFPEIDCAKNPNGHRLLNIHRNVPGVLRAINSALSEYNVSAQVLGTKGSVGYLIVELDSEASDEAKSKLIELAASIRTRVLY